jgi:dipeptidase E
MSAAVPEHSRPGRMLLTSAGVSTALLVATLRELVGQPLDGARVVMVTTAATAQPGPHDWLVEDINRTHGLGWAQFSMLEPAGLPVPVVLDRLAAADVIYVTGGNGYHLARTIEDTGLAAGLLELLTDRVYVGASAGSMLFTDDFTTRLTSVFGTDDDLYQAAGHRHVSPVSLFEWMLLPHAHPGAFDGIADRIGCPVYAIDDRTAVRVTDGAVDVISDGWWQRDTPTATRMR